MKDYKILSDYAEELQAKVNEYAEQGYEIDRVLQQSDNGSEICIIMVKDTEVQKQKQTIYNLIDSVIQKVSTLLAGEVSISDILDMDEDDLKDAASEFYDKLIKGKLN